MLTALLGTVQWKPRQWCVRGSKCAPVSLQEEQETLWGQTIPSDEALFLLLWQPLEQIGAGRRYESDALVGAYFTFDRLGLNHPNPSLCCAGL